MRLYINSMIFIAYFDRILSEHYKSCSEKVAVGIQSAEQANHNHSPPKGCDCDWPVNELSEV